MNTKKRRKLPSGTTARAVPEWVGKTPDAKPPKAVKLRIVRRQKGKCAATGVKFGPGAEPVFDHIRSLVLGGENRESNLQAIVRIENAAKAAIETAIKAKADRQAAAALGIKPQPKGRPLQSRNDLARPKTESKVSADGERIGKKQSLPPRLGGGFRIIERKD